MTEKRLPLRPTRKFLKDNPTLPLFTEVKHPVEPELPAKDKPKDNLSVPKVPKDNLSEPKDNLSEPKGKTCLLCRHYRFLNGRDECNGDSTDKSYLPIFHNHHVNCHYFHSIKTKP
jgi:hypothetical protein